MKKLLLSTDFSPIARQAYPAAASLARDFGATVEIVHEAETLPPLYYESSTPGISADAFYDRLEKQLQKELALPGLRDLDVAPHLLREDMEHATLVDFASANDIDLIVLSTHGYTGLAHALLGSFAERVARRSPVPVLTFRPKQGQEKELVPFAPRSILVPFDFSDNARIAFPTVRLLSQRFDSRITMLHVRSDELVYAYGEVYRQALLDWKEVEAASLQQLREVCAEEFEGHATTTLVSSGNPYLEIVQTAEDTSADLIVMATHGWTGLKHFFLGSIAEKVLRKAPCPVLTVRPTTIEQRRDGGV